MLERLLGGERPDLNALVEAFGTAVPSLHQMQDTPQDPEWHAEGDVHIHTQMVLDELYLDFDHNPGLSPKTQRELILGVLCHDLAKPFTTRRQEIKGVERVVAPRHEAKGRSIIATALVDAGLPWDSLWRVMGIVGSHHEPKMLVVKDKTPGEYRRISRRVDPALVSRLERADMRGRICPDKQTQLDYIDLFEMGCEEYAPAGWQKPWQDYFRDLTADRSTTFRDRVFGEAIRGFEADKFSSPESAGFLLHQENENPPDFVVLCGPSGSGKSTFIERHLPDYEVVSLDLLREHLAGERADQTLNGQVRQEAKAQLRAALRPGRKVVWDATNLRRDFRSALCETGFDYHALVTLVAFQQSPEAYATRNKARTHAVPSKILESQLDQWEWPEPDEAHRLLVLDGSHRVRGAFGFCDETLPWRLDHAD